MRSKRNPSNRGKTSGTDVPVSCVDQYNVVFDAPSKDFHGAVPLGNGDIGVSAWVEADGDLLFFIGKTDAYDENNRLLKLGRVRIKFMPNPFLAGLSFRQELHLSVGELTIHAGTGDAAVAVRMWVDANHPVIRVEIEGQTPLHVQAALEIWRTDRRELPTEELTHSDSARGDPCAAIEYADSILDDQSDRVVWFHHNTRSIWTATLNLQGLGSMVTEQTDPLLDRVFGGAIVGDGLVNAGKAALESTRARKRHYIAVHVLTEHPTKPAQWLESLQANVQRVAAVKLETARAAHRRWWLDFWNRSWIRISGTLDAAPTARGYAVHRYLTVCGGRGGPWVKFNGSIFTVPWEGKGPDFRRWGSASWFQNARLHYWPMIVSGDYDVMAPFYQTYLDALPLAVRRTAIYYGHEGAFFPETMYFWGTYANGDYGWDRGNHPLGYATNPYVRYYWQGGLELSAMMLEQYANTQDRQFATGTLLPLAAAIVQFYDQHYPRDGRGKIRFEPAASLETWHVAVNPLPEIAGLKYVVKRLLELPADLISEEQRRGWERLLGELPDLPMRDDDGKKFLVPAEAFHEERNMENPELYAVFPYRLFGLMRDRLDIALGTFNRRVYGFNERWWQDDIHAACLGLAAEARRCVFGRFNNNDLQFRFPAMWGPKADDCPDMNHGGVGQLALQYMLMQPVGDAILLFPAWPKQWNVEFKLHAPKNTIVEGVYRDGELQQLKVTPASRIKDVVKLAPQ